MASIFKVKQWSATNGDNQGRYYAMWKLKITKTSFLIEIIRKKIHQTKEGEGFYYVQCEGIDWLIRIINCESDHSAKSRLKLHFSPCLRPQLSFPWLLWAIRTWALENLVGEMWIFIPRPRRAIDRDDTGVIFFWSAAVASTPRACTITVIVWEHSVRCTVSAVSEECLSCPPFTGTCQKSIHLIGFTQLSFSPIPIPHSWRVGVSSDTWLNSLGSLEKLKITNKTAE